MTKGYDRPLYLMAFDHRGSFEHDLFHATVPLADSVRAGIVDAKNLIFEGFLQAVDQGAPPEAAGVLVDEEFGTEVARQAQRRGFVLAMPVERSGQAEFDFEYGEDFASHIEHFDPTFAKVLVRFNPEGDQELNRRQTERLTRLGAWLSSQQRKFLFELLVPATPAQLEAVGADQARYDRQLRPELVVRTIAWLQDGGVEPDVWKIEGLETEAACAQVVAQAQCGGRSNVPCIVLGRGADEAKVLQWLAVAASVPGFDGFAVGRTLWERPLQRYLSNELQRDQAVAAIAQRYLETLRGFTPS